MHSVKAVSKGLKWIECERGIRGKCSPVPNIPKQNPMQDSIKKNKMTSYFKLILPNTGNDLKVAIWAFRTPKHLLLHVSTTIHACK